MAHFRAGIQGQRGEASRLGSKKTGLTAYVNGWHAGVSVYAQHDEKTGADTFQVYATSGSNGAGQRMLVGEVRYVEVGGWEWLPMAGVAGHKGDLAHG